MAGLLVARVTQAGEGRKARSSGCSASCPPPSACYFIPSLAGPAHKLASKGGAAAQALGCRAEHALAEVLGRTGSLSAGIRTHVEEGSLGRKELMGLGGCGRHVLWTLF